MSEHKIQAHLIEKPFQLLAAWFIILFLITGLFVTGASTAKEPSWLAPAFTIAAITYPLIVFAIVFILQTLFRPTLQNDDKYSEWLRDRQSYQKLSEPPPISPLDSNRLAITQNTEKEIKELHQKVESLIETTPPAELPPTIDELFRESANRIQEFETTSEYSISLSWIPEAEKVRSDLVSADFRVEIYQDPFISEPLSKHNLAPLKDHTAIWLGTAVPLKFFLNSLSIVRGHWPHLRYIHLSTDSPEAPDDIHYEIFYGGATSTVKRYGLKPFSDEEFIYLFQAKSLIELHAMIRNKYKT